MRTSPRLGALVCAFICSLILQPSAFPQGSLTPPPGAPAPTMKTLDQIEPRIDVQNAPAAAVTTTNANYHFIINQPGSYYLSANLGVTKTNGIQINAEGVTLDVNGFQISRASGTGGNGIEIAAASHRASVRNGSVKGFANGVNSISSTARACAFRDLSASNCTVAGIITGVGAVLESCRAHDNSGNAGIEAGTGSSLTNCSACFNTSAATLSAGFGASSSCTISHCTARSNTSTAGTFTATTGMGFTLDSTNTIYDCTASNNKGDGIRIGNHSIARDNTCNGNGSVGGDGAGIHASSIENRIEGNNVTFNDRGIDVGTAGNLIIRNSAKGNTTNYSIVANNVFGAIVDRTAPASAAVNGNSAASSAATTDPWANISY